MELDIIFAELADLESRYARYADMPADERALWDELFARSEQLLFA